MAVAALSVLAGCDGRQAAIQPAACSPVPSKGQIDAANAATARSANDFTDDETIAVDCLIMTARRYSTSADVSSVVAKAVVTACKPQVEAAGTDVYARKAGNSPEAAQAASGEADRIEGELNDLALKYVVEARSTHCLPVRPSEDVELPPELYRID